MHVTLIKNVVSCGNLVKVRPINKEIKSLSKTQMF